MNDLLRSLMLGLLLAGLPALAAQAPAGNEAPEAEAETVERADGGSAAADVPAAEDEAGAQEDGEDNAGEGEAESVALEDEDFVPSVQISEDLSVSFPVDI